MKHRISLAGAVLLVSGFAVVNTAAAQDTLNLIGWCEISDPKVNEPFEKAHNVKINIKTHEDPAAAQTIIENSAPGDWDLFYTDAAMIPTHVRKGMLEPLDQASFDFNGLFPSVRQPEMHTVDRKLYGVPVVFGWNTVAYNKSKVAAEDIKSYSVLWNPKYKGRIAVWDFYTQIFQNIALSLGIKPGDINKDNFPKIDKRLMELKANVAVVGDISTIQTALATGDVDIVLGGGQWIVGGLRTENPNLDWTVPEEGGVFYLESLTVLASSKKKELAKEYVQYIASQEGQGHMAMNKCSMAMPANPKATLTDADRTALRWDQKDKDLSNSYLNKYYDQDLDKLMQETWARFVQK